MWRPSYPIVNLACVFSGSSRTYASLPEFYRNCIAFFPATTGPETPVNSKTPSNAQPYSGPYSTLRFDRIANCMKFSNATNENNYHVIVSLLKRTPIERALKRAEGSHTEAARIVGFSPSYLCRLLHNLGVKVFRRTMTRRFVLDRLFRA